MSNLSNIGFGASTQEESFALVQQACALGSPIEVSEGYYVAYTEASGVELWIQFDHQQEVLGFNPHFRGKSKRSVRITADVERLESKLDGAFYAWADPTEDGDPESGTYPFVFDLPNAQKYTQVKFPQDIDIQLTAFAQELSLYVNEDDFDQAQEGEFKWAAQSFIPSGLFSPDDSPQAEPPGAYGIFAGSIREFSLKTNEMTGQSFYWLLADTLGGQIDIVADTGFFETAPQTGGIVQGQFWLSGDFLTAPLQIPVKQRTNFFKNLFK